MTWARADTALVGYAVTVDLAAAAFVHAHPDGDEAAVAELRAAGVTVVGTAQSRDGIRG